MLTIEEAIDVTCPYDFSGRCPLEDLLLFDIETTGLSADISSLYLIGCLGFRDGSWRMSQWLADGYGQEEEILEAFFSLASSFQVLLHYNGNGFDLPYLRKKCERLGRDFPLSRMESLDLYKTLLPFKKPLGLASLRLASVERLLGARREDPYGGKELISVYGDYLHGKILGEDAIALRKKEDALLLHNREDLIGLLLATPVLALDDLVTKDPVILSATSDGGALKLEASLPSPLPFPVALEREGTRLSLQEGEGTARIPLTDGKIRVYYENYRDYYYLPAEDCAIHKSVAAFVDKAYRQRATKDTCYASIPVTPELLGDPAALARCFRSSVRHALSL